MASMALKVLLTLYISYSLLKFFDFFFIDYERRIVPIRDAYREGSRTIEIFDAIVLALVIVMIALLFAAGIEYLSFATGLLAGMTIIQVYFHRFSTVLSTDKMPDPPASAIKLMSYSIQAEPARAWRELALMTLLFVWALYMLATRGFGLGW